MTRKIIIGIVVFLVVVVLGNIILPVDRAAIEVAAEPIGLGPITNALFTSIILSVIIVIAAFLIGRTLKEKPSGVQNVVEFVLEVLDGFIQSIAPRKWAATFFPILATIFIYLLFANWFSLLTPLLGSFGLVYLAEGEGIPVENVSFISGSPDNLTYLHHGGAEEVHEEETEAVIEEDIGAEDAESPGSQQVMIVPIFRAPSSDLNLTVGLAIVSVVLTQIFGFMEQGGAYLRNFFRFDAFSKKGIGMGFIDFIVGLIEGVSELFKLISFSFRLFGNIFAGEVVLIVISSLVSLLLILVFFGIEIFVGLIQAFVFFILSLVFFTIATSHHGEHEEGHVEPIESTPAV
jgi:F-type H+-transporting ATPase subunit a